jgi:hypothetical protein
VQSCPSAVVPPCPRLFPPALVVANAEILIQRRVSQE